MTDDPPTDSVPVLTFATAGLPRQERYAAWLNRDWPRTSEIYRTEPTEPFDTFWQSAPLGEILFVYTRITGMRWERRRETIRASDFDPVIVNMMIAGHAEGDMDGRAFREAAGCFHFHDLARPSLHVSSASETYSVVLPRPLAEAWLAPLEGLHGLVVAPPASDMLLSHAREVHRALDRLTHAAAERLGRVFLELIAAALPEDRAGPDQGPAARLRARAMEQIERRIGGETITSERLGALLGVGRAELFDAFGDEGGVRGYVLRVRLERAQAALADLGRAEPIGNIAHRFGFTDASHLSRTFRARFGMTPREYRKLVAANRNGTGAGPG